MRVFIILSLLGVTLAGHLQMTRIIGGEDTTIENHPFMAHNEFNEMSIVWARNCGGALLTSRSVLTAAHCFRWGEQVRLYRVRLGSSLASKGGSVHLASELVLHPEYSHETLEHDVAIIRLATPAVMSDSVAVARIAGPNYNLPDGTVVTALGWGTLSFNGTFPEVLQRVDVNLINQQLCAERIAHLKTQPCCTHWPDITDGMLCSGILDVGGKDACLADGGGPLVHDSNIVVGISSLGLCGDKFYPSANTRVSHYANWIVAEGSS